jgi:3-deoxy-D-manno-octulosonic-acid transferase
MVLLFYNLALLVVLVLGLPWWLWRIATTAKYREGIRARLGQVPAELRGDGRPAIWLHAVSVGEVLAVSRLVGELEAAFPNHRLLISTTTRTGQALAREKFGAERVFYCPLDLPWAVRAYLSAIQPKLLILAETEFWPNLLSGCFRRGIPVAVVNARISDRSWPRYRALRSLWQPFLSQLGLVLAQSELDAERLTAIGCMPDRVHVAGNLKFDVRAASESQATGELKQRGAGLRFIVAGSTLDDEETALLNAWPQLLAADSNLALILAPRHPERFAEVAALLNRSGRLWVRRSAWNDQPFESLKAGRIILLDTIGELASIYSLASVAFVGGSLVPAGGHNPLEPAQFGVPMVMGPYYENFRSMVDDLRAHDAIRIADREALAAELTGLLSNRADAEAMGTRAREVFERQAGATARSIKAMRALLEAAR